VLDHPRHPYSQRLKAAVLAPQTDADPSQPPCTTEPVR